MVNVKKRKGRVVIDSDSEDSASDDNLDQVKTRYNYFCLRIGRSCVLVLKGLFWVTLARTSMLVGNCAAIFLNIPALRPVFFGEPLRHSTSCSMIGRVTQFNPIVVWKAGNCQPIVIKGAGFA